MSYDGLVKWANFYTRGHDHIKPVSDLTKSWADGLGFCALVYNWFPDKIPINDLKTDTEQDKINNCNLAFQVAFEEAGVEKYLDGEDMVGFQDKKSIVLYLSEFYAAVNDKPVKFTPSDEWSAKYEAKMLLERRTQMEAAAQASGKMPAQRAATVTPAKVTFTTTTTVKGGLTPKSGTGSLWSNRMGPPTAPDDQLPEFTPKTTNKLKQNLGSLLDSEGGPPIDNNKTDKDEKKDEKDEKNEEKKKDEKNEEKEKEKEEKKLEKKERKDNSEKTGGGGKNPLQRGVTVNTSSTRKGAETSETPSSKEEDKKPSASALLRQKKYEETRRKEQEALAAMAAQLNLSASTPAKKTSGNTSASGSLASSTSATAPPPQAATPPPPPVVHVIPPPSSKGINYTITGRSKNGGVANAMMIISVAITVDGEIEEAQKDDLEVIVEGPKVPPRVNVMGGKGGVFHVGFTSKEAVLHWLDFVYKGTYANQPYQLPVKTAAGEMEDLAYEGKGRPNWPTSGSTATEDTSTTTDATATATAAAAATATAAATVTATAAVTVGEVKKEGGTEKDIKQQQQQQQQQDPEKPKEKEKVSSKKDNTATTATQKKDVKAFASNCTASFPHTTLSDTDIGTFTVTLRDANNKPINPSGPVDFNVSISTADSVKVVNNDGVYECSFGPLNEGVHSISVTVDGKSIKGSPFSVTVSEGIEGAELAEVTILIQAINKHGEPVSRGGDFTLFTVESKGGKTSHLQDSGLEDGRYHFDYKSVSGSNYINVVSNATGKSIDGLPLSWNV